MTTTSPQDLRQAVLVSRDVRDQIEAFLFDEADLLDRDEFDGWLDLMAPEVHYFARVRQTLRRVGGPGFSGAFHALGRQLHESQDAYPAAPHVFGLG